MRPITLLVALALAIALGLASARAERPQSATAGGRADSSVAIPLTCSAKGQTHCIATLRDGSMYRGRLVRAAPGDRVVFRWIDGSLLDWPWEQVAYLAAVRKPAEEALTPAAQSETSTLAGSAPQTAQDSPRLAMELGSTLRLLSTSQPPKLLGMVSLPAPARQLIWLGRAAAYLRLESGGIAVVDIRAPSHPEVVWLLASWGTISKIVSLGPLLCVMRSAQPLAYDLSDELRPRGGPLVRLNPLRVMSPTLSSPGRVANLQFAMAHGLFARIVGLDGSVRNARPAAWLPGRQEVHIPVADRLEVVPLPQVARIDAVEWTEPEVAPASGKPTTAQLACAEALEPAAERERKAQADAAWAKQAQAAKAEAYASRTRAILISGAVLVSVGLAVSGVGIWAISEANKRSNSIDDAAGGVGGLIIGVPGGIPLLIGTVLLPIGIYRSTR